MSFRLEIATDNAAFEGDPASGVARVLRKLADKLDTYDLEDAAHALRDSNGNTVGRWEWAG